MSSSSSFAVASTSGRTACTSSELQRRRQSSSSTTLTVARSAAFTSSRPWRSLSSPPSSPMMMPPSLQLGKPLSSSHLSRTSPLSPRLQRGPAPPCAIVKKELVRDLFQGVFSPFSFSISKDEKKPPAILVFSFLSPLTSPLLRSNLTHTQKTNAAPPGRLLVPQAPLRRSLRGPLDQARRTRCGVREEEGGGEEARGVLGAGGPRPRRREEEGGG